MIKDLLRYILSIFRKGPRTKVYCIDCAFFSQPSIFCQEICTHRENTTVHSTHTYKEKSEVVLRLYTPARRNCFNNCSWFTNMYK